MIQRRAEEPQAIVHLVVAQIAGGEGIHRLAELDGEPVGVTPAHGAGHGRCHTVGQHVHHDRAGHAAEEVGHLHGEDRAVVRQGERHGVVGEGVFQDAHAVLGPDEAAVGQRAADAGGQQRQRLTGGDGGGQAIHRLRRRGGDVGKADCACAANFHRILQQVVLDDLGQRRNRRVALRADGKADAVAAAAFTVEDLGVILLATDERDVLAHQLAGGAEKGVGRLADQLLAGRIDGVHGIGVHPQLTDVVHGAVEAILTIAGRDEVGVGLAQIVVEARVAQRGLHAEVLLIDHGCRQSGDVVEVHRLKLVVVGREVGGRIQAGQLVEAGDEVIVAGVEFRDHRGPGRDGVRISQVGGRDEDGVGRGGIGGGIRPHHGPAVAAGAFLVEDFHVVPLVGHQGVVGRESRQGSNRVHRIRGRIGCDQDFAQGIGARRVDEQRGMVVVADPELVVAVGRRHEVGVALGAVIVLAAAERRDHVETEEIAVGDVGRRPRSEDGVAGQVINDGAVANVLIDLNDHRSDRRRKGAGGAHDRREQVVVQVADAADAHGGIAGAQLATDPEHNDPGIEAEETRAKHGQLHASRIGDRVVGQQGGRGGGNRLGEGDDDFGNRIRRQHPDRTDTHRGDGRNGGVRHRQSRHGGGHGSHARSHQDGTVLSAIVTAENGAD